jgi:hypothetical protein
VNTIRQHSRDNIYVVFYTSKANVVNFFSFPEVDRSTRARLGQRGFFVHQHLMKFNSGQWREGWDYLYKQVAAEISCSPDSRQCTELRRVGLLTWAASYLLDLPYSAAVYITRSEKNLRFIEGDLHVDHSKVYLFDDKADSHAATIGETPAIAHMIQTPVYNTPMQSIETARALHRALEKYFNIPPDFVKTYRSLAIQASRPDPNWSQDRVALHTGGRAWLSHEQDAGTIPYQPWDVSLVIAGMDTSPIRQTRLAPGYGRMTFSHMDSIRDDLAPFEQPYRSLSDSYRQERRSSGW